MMLRQDGKKDISRTLLTCILMIAFCGWSICCFSQQDYYKKPDDSKIPPVKSRLNYAPMAAELTAGCGNDYEKIKAIYQWICEHIAYDTSYKIRSADECLKKQKGVCQAYCELFYLLAKAANIRVETWEGKSKDQTGFINPAGHGWLFAYTRENHGILMDPTWGAGSVESGQFVRDDNIWLWFNVAPERMILSHFPNDAACQLLENPVTEKEFLAFPPAKLVWMEYGLNDHQLFESAREQKLVLPQFYNGGEGIVEFIDIPFSTSLNVGTTYTFRVKMNSEREFAVMNNGAVSRKSEWTDEGNGVYSIQFMPRETESLSISMQDESGTSRSTRVRYEIATPTQAEWSVVARHYPLSTPEMKAVKNMNAREWAAAGIDEFKLAELVRAQGVTELPTLYDGRGQQLTIASVPMNREMKTGESYTFSFYPKTEGKWAVVNGQDWFTDWQIAEDGMHSITVSPKTSGRLSLFVQNPGEDSYWSCLEYMVP